MASRNVTLTKIHPVSAFKVATLLALVGFAAWLLAASILYAFLAAAGVVDSLNSLIGGVGGETGIGYPLVLGLAGVSGTFCVIFVAIMAPLTAYLYNALVDIVGGVTVELTDYR